MILGHKPSSHVVFYDENGNKVEAEMRQCIHCQYSWIYRPGSGARRGFCLKCYGVTCGRPGCASRGCSGPFEKLIGL